MFISKLSGFRYLTMLSALMVVFFGVIFNGLMIFSQYLERSQDQFSHSMILKYDLPRTKDEVEELVESLQKFHHVRAIQIQNIQDNEISTYLDLQGNQEDFVKDLTSTYDIKVLSLQPLKPFSQIFVGMIRGIFFTILILLIMLTIILTRSIISNHKSTIHTLRLLGSRKTTIAKEFQFKLIKSYGLGTIIGAILLGTAFFLLHSHELSYSFLKFYFTTQYTIITIVLTPILVTLLCTVISMIAVYAQLYRIK